VEERFGVEDKEGLLPIADMTGKEGEPRRSDWVDRGF
jgi:hypothetical protein